ncbi:hypothetical protein SASPL_104664 [Salvia splendens]|uniref:Diphosphomevalonate decarboxylase n=1 Tax=Salvia splendens TaxID=180675 RepID=A0A8X8YHX0_SALSN|nr:hypothetical protein SASPL_104664 [Salvia splendens]
MNIYRHLSKKLREFNGGEKWVLSVTAQTPTNIAVIKYWGKRDEELILPINDSISVTLDPGHLCTTTSVAVSPAFTHDRIWLNGKEVSFSGARFQNCLRELRSRATDFEDEKRGIKITKKDWEKLRVHIVSYNNFPTAAGLASSAAGLACLVFSLAKLMNVKEDQSKLSAIARSGSACMGKEDNESDSIADEKHWDDLVIIIAVVSSKQKETSSTSGMRSIKEMEEAIAKRDFPSFARLACADRLSAVLRNGIVMKDHLRKRITGGFDAGPNAVLNTKDRKTAALLLQRLLFHFPPQSDADLSSYVIGDKTKLKDAGIEDLKDIEALAPPPEIKENASTQRYRGDVSYFICTRPGRCPVVLADESQSLINPETGLPK